MLSRTEVKKIPNMSWDLYKRINKFDYLILQNPNARWGTPTFPLLFRRDGLHLILSAIYHERRWKNFDIEKLKKYTGYMQNDDLNAIILLTFDINKPKDFVNHFYLPDLFRKGFQLIDGKSKRWFKNELYHEQFMDALELSL